LTAEFAKGPDMHAKGPDSGGVLTAPANAI
jgi:hypothetical protein